MCAWVSFPAAAHLAAESNIAVNAKGPLSNCLLLIMMMRVPLPNWKGGEKGWLCVCVVWCGMQISGSGVL